MEIAEREDRPLGPQQVKAAFLLAHGMRHGQVAPACGVNRKPLYRWRERRLFRDALREFEDERIANLGHELEGAVAMIVDALKEEGVPEMRDQLVAADPEGHPLLSTRREAFKELREALKALRPPEARVAGASAQAGVYLVVEEPGAMRIVPVEAAVEGSYVEVAEDPPEGGLPVEDRSV